MKHAAEFEFAYLQLHSQYSPFGGLAQASELSEELASFGVPIAAALTDTFSLAAIPEWWWRLEEAEIRPLVGAEIGISWETGGSQSLPASLILLVESRQGYRNLCRIISEGLQNAGSNPLTACISSDILARYHEGLVAIAPYYGGPITAALKLKAAEAKNRAQSLREIFGPEHFFFGAPPPAGQPTPNTAEGQQDSRMAAVTRLNSSLVKLARDLKIGLIGTGEARYLVAEEAGSYTALRNRLGRALAEQYSPNRLQQPQDWLYAIRPDRPTADLQLYPPQILINHYNNKDWPEALANNRAIARRCASWHFEDFEALSELRQRCLTELERRYAEVGPEEVQIRAWLESELADVEELNLAGPLLAMAKTIEATREIRQVAIARRLSGSLVAWLLGLSERPPETVEGDTFRFKFEEGSRPLRLEVGQNGRARLLAALNSGAMDEESFMALPVATPASEAGGVAMLHPRQIALSINGQPLGDMTPAQLAVSNSDGKELHLAAQVGRGMLPPGVYRLEVSESLGVARLQLALDIYNQWRIKGGLPPLAPEEMGQPVEGDSPREDQQPGSFERFLVQFRLNWFKEQFPAAYYAAALSLAEPGKRAGLVEAIRQAHLKILPPSVQAGQPYFVMEDETTLRAGLTTVLSREKAEAVATTHPKSLEELVKKCSLPLSKEDWAKLGWAGALDEFANREAIAEAASELAQIGQQWQEWQQRQSEAENESENVRPESKLEPLTLFDLFESAEVAEELPALPEPKMPELPEIPPLSPLQKLRKQAEVLNFYTSEHPLWQQLIEDNKDNTRLGPLTLVEVLAKGSETGKPLTLAGMITGLRRLPFTEGDGRGQELAVVWLEDWTCRIELLIPPKLAAGTELSEGTALTVEARWLKSDSRPALVAEGLNSYPPSGEFTRSEEEVALDDNLAMIDEPSLVNLTPPPPEDDSWANSLFAEYGASLPASPANQAQAQGQNQPQNQNRGRNVNSGGPKKSAAPRPLVRHVYINLHLVGDEAADNALMNQVKQILREHSGEDSVHIYLHWPDGEPPDHLEPQSLSVTYTLEFAGAIRKLLGDSADAISTEERPA